MTTELAVVRQLRNTLNLPERDRGAAEAVAAGLRDAKAENGSSLVGAESYAKAAIGVLATGIRR